jgi:DNA helicase-2/ATP-dependent DNA helicase PcrA
MTLNYQEYLNNEQLEAVTYDGGPLVVIAGAGSGKTRVLTHRIAYLIRDKRLYPQEILAITFTNKAAGEMKQRVEKLLSDEIAGIWVSTFHSCCVRILRAHAAVIGYKPGFSIYDESDSKRLMDEILKERNVDKTRVSAKFMLGVSGHIKMNGYDSEEIEIRYQNTPRQILELYYEYQKRLKELNAMDFDDLINNTLILFKESPELLKFYQTKFSHILVDEYQDTNKVQNELVISLTSSHRQVTIVGDPDQSIYGFRGASASNLEDFKKVFNEARIIKLEQNYRSNQHILNAANELIKHNKTFDNKVLWSQLKDGEEVTVKECLDQSHEAELICSDILRMKSLGIPLNQVAVFYRTNGQSRAIEESLRLNKIPYKVVGSTSFYERKEVKDILSYATILANPYDELSFKRAAMVPKKGIGDQSLKKFIEFSREFNFSLLEALDHLDQINLSAKAKSGLKEFQELYNLAGELVNEASPGHLLEFLIDKSGYKRELEIENTSESEARLSNIGELCSLASSFETLEEFLAHASLISYADQIDDGDAIYLMTVHIAKGLEFEAVFVAGMENGLFPHARSIDEGSLEEERRLCYVAVTRAKKYLYLYWAKNRVIWGNPIASKKSVFLEEMRGALKESDMQLVNKTFGTQNKPSQKYREPITKTNADKLELSPGDWVEHARWGKGKILSVSGLGDDKQAEIEFLSVGKKRFLLAYSPLSRII